MSTAQGATPTFCLRGTRNGSPVDVSWSPGSLRGDPPTVDLMLAELEIAAACHGDPVCDLSLAAIAGDCGTSPLHDPCTAYALAERVLDSIREVAAEPAGLAAELQRRRTSTTSHRADRKEQPGAN